MILKARWELLLLMCTASPAAAESETEAGPRAPGELPEVAFIAPRLLSCDHSEDWSSYSATLDSLKDPPADPSEEAAYRSGFRSSLAMGLPTVCSKKDATLFSWSNSLTNMYWPSEGDPWDALQNMQYNCDPDRPGGRDEEKCPSSLAAICLYGIVSCMACMAVMYANHAATSSDWTTHALSAATSLQALLMSHEKVLEFLDFASWPFSLEDVAAIVDAYALSLRSNIKAPAGGSPSRALRPGARPWNPGKTVWLTAQQAATESLQLVAHWRWPPRVNVPHCAVHSVSASEEPRPLRLWAFGTHCSLMSEPVSAIALLLKLEVTLQVTWRGTKDYCGYHSGEWPLPVKDTSSAVRAVLDEFSVKKTKIAKKGRNPARSTHRDSVRNPVEFAQALRVALDADDEFAAADIAFCSEPAYACAAMHEAGKPLIGYFGVHIGFMVREKAEQLQLYRYFRDSIAQDQRSTLATVAPYISLQMFYNLPVEVPAIRPLSLYTLPAVYTATRANEVLLNKRPIAFWDPSAILNACLRAGKEEALQFIDAAELYKFGRSSYHDWGEFRAAVYFPYDWLQTLTFYDWVNMGIPTFVPDTPLYTYASGTNAPGELDATTWHVPPAVYPHHFSDWHDLNGRVYWWLLTDFRALPGVGSFTSAASLFMVLANQTELWRMSGRLRQGQMERTAQATSFWRSAVFRALDTGEKDL